MLDLLINGVTSLAVFSCVEKKGKLVKLLQYVIVFVLSCLHMFTMQYCTFGL